MKKWIIIGIVVFVIIIIVVILINRSKSQSVVPPPAGNNTGGILSMFTNLVNQYLPKPGATTTTGGSNPVSNGCGAGKVPKKLNKGYNFKNSYWEDENGNRYYQPHFWSDTEFDSPIPDNFFEDVIAGKNTGCGKYYVLQGLHKKPHDFLFMLDSQGNKIEGDRIEYLD